MIRTCLPRACALLLTLVGAASETLAADLVIQRQHVADWKIVFATVESTDVTRARARIGGTLHALAIDEGDRVERGALIATIVDDKLPQQLAALDARIESLAARVELATVDLERVRALRERGTVSQARLDEAQSTFDALAGELAATRAEREVVRQQQREGDVLAPATGRVLEVQAIDGTVVLPGESIATIAVETYVLRLRLPERHARFMRVGDEVLVGHGQLTATEDHGAVPRARLGRVRQVYPQMDNGRVIADVEVAGLGSYFVGERVPVHVATGQRETIVVPRGYVYRRHGLAYARLASGSEVVIQPGREVDAGVEVLSGLKPGDTLSQP